MATQVLTSHIEEPLNGAVAATIDIKASDSNLTIDGLNSQAEMLAAGTLQYPEKRSVPTRSVALSNGQATLTLRGDTGGRPWFHFPWEACNAATEWQLHVNPTISSNIIAHTGGGNVKLDLRGMTVSHVGAGSGGGNLDVLLPDHAANLSVTAQTGAGNVTVEIGAGASGSNTVVAGSGAGNVEVCLPSGLAARLHVSTGWGKAIVDPRFSQVDRATYQSPGYDSAVNKVEISAKSGAGNVSVSTK